jgi:serine phosphatase RsbU (regulator of sigma subunit)
VYITLLDVAGHGLSAALTVNRLFGELERIRAESPNAEPADVMLLLNRYINLTMAKHDLYATGTCMMLDPCHGTLTWVNAGHPPSFLRRTDGSIADLPATTVLLGALGPEEFTTSQQTMTLRPGDVVISYTDGAFEARNRAGRQFGLGRLRSTAQFSPPPRDWTRFIATAVAKHHDGNADDDVLIATLTLRSLRIDIPDAASVTSDVAAVSVAP